ncbi:hypothetical protein IT774_16400 [Salinimonas marina]|uniref:Uncharacterized protein n=1 Tax=Salinimonas marina TaxID=2785918 RepID=A0A7S9DX79_9ALTE|nr:hypothetical protein [Salinimonas marina]QPG05634.1 hypothetical protein IT774_16400 [Salinimonas marina]
MTPSPPEPLQTLWQSQPAPAINTQAVRKRLRRMQFRHWCYVILDILALVPVSYFLFWQKALFSPLVWLWLMVIGIMALGYTLYILWLRRQSLFWQDHPTAHYVLLLHQQYRQQARIARAAKHSAWVFQLLLTGLFGMCGWEGSSTGLSWQWLAGIWVINALAMSIFYHWAAQRQHRFTAEAAGLKQMTG